MDDDEEIAEDVEELGEMLQGGWGGVVLPLITVVEFVATVAAAAALATGSFSPTELGLESAPCCSTCCLFTCCLEG